MAPDRVAGDLGRAFLLCYVTAAIWCAKLAGPDGSLWRVRVAIAVYTVLALVGIGIIGWIGYRRHSFGGGTLPHDVDTPEDRHRFLGFATLLLSALSAVASLTRRWSSFFFGSCRLMRRVLLIARACSRSPPLWLGPLPQLAQQAFSAHMTMHMGVVAVAAPLLALGVAGGRLDPVRRVPGLFPPIPASSWNWSWCGPGTRRRCTMRRDIAIGGFVAEQGMFLLGGSARVAVRFRRRSARDGANARAPESWGCCSPRCT